LRTPACPPAEGDCGFNWFRQILKSKIIRMQVQLPLSLSFFEAFVIWKNYQKGDPFRIAFFKMALNQNQF